MQSPWPGLPNWLFFKIAQSSGLSEPKINCSRPNSASPGQGLDSHCASFPSSATTSTPGQDFRYVSRFHFPPNEGRIGVEGKLAAVVQAASCLLRLFDKVGINKLEKNLKERGRRLRTEGGREVLEFGRAVRSYGQVAKKGGNAAASASLLFEKIASVLPEGWRRFRNRNTLPTVFGAMLPPSINTSSNILPFPTLGDVEPGKLCMVGKVEDTIRERWKLDGKQTGQAVVEPNTGISFPLQIGATPDDQGTLDQVLTGVGFRAKSLIKLKSITMYAFGLYVQPDQLRERIGGKYAGLSPEELILRPEFYDDLLSQGVDMTMRLVVHFKGLKMGMIRRAFEASLKLRLKKIKGSVEDDGLNNFCSLLAGDVPVFRGTTIDFRWQPAGGALQAEISGRRLGTVYSHHLCRAFFEMYMGDPAVSEPAKRAIGTSFAQLLTMC